MSEMKNLRVGFIDKINQYTTIFSDVGITGKFNGVSVYYWEIGSFYFWIRYSPFLGMEQRWTKSFNFHDPIEIEDVLEELPSEIADQIIFNLEIFRT